MQSALCFYNSLFYTFPKEAIKNATQTLYADAHTHTRTSQAKNIYDFRLIYSCVTKNATRKVTGETMLVKWL